MDSDGTTALATLLHGTISHFYRKIVVITHSEPLMVALQPNRVMVMSKDANGNSFCEQREIQPLGIVGG
jgi:DNA repair exonuclease SbcCD ATPase subunit